jgi:hypothetical protein
MAAKMKALRSDFLAAILSEAKREARFNRGVVRQYDWLRHYPGGYPAFGTRSVGII